MHPDPLGRSADEILGNRLTDKYDHSSWHFFQARSWLDLAHRTDNPSALQYAALELRYGTEYLLFELLVLKNHFLDEKEYQRCIGDRAEMEKMLKHVGPNYPKLCRFTELVVQTGAPSSSLKFRYWSLKEIAATFGIASEMIHFLGAHNRTHRNPEWCKAAIARISTVFEPMWKAVTETHGSPLLNPEQMEPEVRQAWDAFRTGALTEDDLVAQIRVLAPILNDRIAARLTGRISLR